MVLKKCTLHIGSGKCGTTALQSILERERAWLTSQGVALFVPNDLAEINAMSMATYLQHSHPSEAHMITSRKVAPVLDQEERLARQRARFAATGADHLVVSNEYFTDFHPSRHAARLAILKKLMPACDDVTIVYYVRRPDDLFVSLYLQWFMPEIPVSMSTFYREFDFGGARGNALSLNWYQHARAIAEHFPAAKVIVRPYEEAAAVGIVRDFTRSASLGTLPASAIESQSNVSLRGLGYQIHKRVGRMLPTPARRLLSRALLRVNPRTRFDRTLLLPARLRREILDFYRSDFSRLFREFGVGDESDLKRLWYRG